VALTIFSIVITLCLLIAAWLSGRGETPPMTPLHALLLALAVGRLGPVQDTTASIEGRVIDRANAPIPLAMVFIDGTQHQTSADSKGRFQLTHLATGVIRLSVRMIGYQHYDKLVTLRPRQRLTWNVVMEGFDWSVRATAHDSAVAALGGLDSIASGLAGTDTTSAFTYEGFGVRLLRAAIAQSSHDSSRILSPLSAGQALALALSAARDSTALAIERGLQLGRLDEAQLSQRSHRFNATMRARRDIALDVANALLVDTSQTLQPDFGRRARALYGAEVRTVPLRLPSIVDVVNHWADSVTKGMIRAIRDRPYDSSVVVVLTNAVYFKGRWLVPFDSAATLERPFTTASGERVSTPTMEREGHLAYRRERGYQALRVPYMAGLTAMYLVLPDSGRTPASVLDDLVQSGWPLPNPHRETRDVQLRLPKLHIEQGTDLRLPFTALDMGILFDSARADFGKLVLHKPGEPPECPALSSGLHMDACTRHRISEARQHVYLDVNEEGTEAAAVTTIGFEVVVTSEPPPPTPFFVDRPFLFALRDERTGTMLFMGFIARPHQ
jgi:serine protease inhibitor